MESHSFENNDAVLVFFDWLSRFTESAQFDSLSDAERRAMWDIEASLESSLSAIVAADYTSAVAAAAKRLIGDGEASGDSPIERA